MDELPYPGNALAHWTIGEVLLLEPDYGIFGPKVLEELNGLHSGEALVEIRLGGDHGIWDELTIGTQQAIEKMWECYLRVHGVLWPCTTPWMF